MHTNLSDENYGVKVVADWKWEGHQESDGFTVPCVHIMIYQTLHSPIGNE